MQHLEHAFNDSLGQLTLRWRAKLAPEQWAALLADFHRAKAHVVYVATLKLECWQKLPWYACILGHADEQVAREGSRRVLELFAACPLEAANHRLTLLVCSSDAAVGQQLRAFAAGQPRSSLPDLYEMCCKLSAIPVTERCVEQQHGAIKLHATFKHVGPLCVTAALRLPEIERDFKSKEDWMQLAAFAEKTKSIRRIPHLLGVQAHGWLRALPAGRALSTHKLVSLLTAVIYRCDAPSQYDYHRAARASNLRETRRRLLAGARAVGETGTALQRGSFLARLATEHFRSTATPECIYTMPSSSAVKVAPLRQHLHAAAGQRKRRQAQTASLSTQTRSSTHCFSCQPHRAGAPSCNLSSK